MANIGNPLPKDMLWLTTGRDFQWTFQNLDDSDTPINYPAGSLFFEIGTSPVTTWTFTISGNTATLKVESTTADLIPARTPWQLVFLPSGETAGGECIALGLVQRQG